MTRLFGKDRLFLFSLIFIFFSAPVFADYTGFENYNQMISLDLPEGFELVESGDNGRYFHLQNTVVPVQAIVRLYPRERYEGSLEALTDVLDRFGADGEADSFEWRNQTSAIGTFTANMLGIPSSGYGAAAVLPKGEGTIVLLTWAEEKLSDLYAPMMTSFIDSLCIDKGSYFETGMLTRYAYPLSADNLPLSLEIDGKKIETFIKENDREASEFLIDREYNVLLYYQSSPLWKEAWQRYYRMIYRDSFHRLMRVSFDIYNALAPSCKDETDLAQKLLTWTQTFSYEREANTSDFASLPSMLLGGGSDCDSRSLLLAVLLKNMNQDAIIFISAEYTHAVCGFISSHPGHSFNVEGKEYLMGETTAKGLTWGMIAKEQDDVSKWIPVVFP